ncbi:DUF6233 domain-containing protein (plasmid) [Streptomyces sp. R39]|uniref:DUF6233 domain-containing protein n=1 Tax=Streptomyces sp. R39 TaxID=3238631 RepID=A0AB39R951_9ACTN
MPGGPLCAYCGPWSTSGVEAGRYRGKYGRRHRPRPPDWIVELTNAKGEPFQVHDGACGMTGRRHRAIGRDEARRLLTADGVPPCPICHPGTQLHIIGEARMRAGRGTTA